MKLKKILSLITLFGFGIVNTIPYANAAIYTSKVDEFIFDVHEKPLLTEWQAHDFQRFTYTNWFTGEKLLFNDLSVTFTLNKYFHSIREVMSSNPPVWNYKANAPFFAIINNSLYNKDAEYGFYLDQGYYSLHIINDVDGEGSTCLYLTNKKQFKKKLEGTCTTSEELRNRDPYVIFFNINYDVLTYEQMGSVKGIRSINMGINAVNIQYLVSKHTFLDDHKNGLTFYKTKTITYRNSDWLGDLYDLNKMGVYKIIGSNEEERDSKKYAYSPQSTRFIYKDTKGQIQFYGLKFSGFLYTHEDVKEKHTAQYFQDNFYHSGNYYYQQLDIRGDVDFLDQLGPFVIKNIYGEPLAKPKKETALDIIAENGTSDASFSLQDCTGLDIGCHIGNLSTTIKAGFFGITSKILEGIKSIFSWIWQNIKGYLEPLIKPIYDFIINIIEEGKIIFEKIKTFFTEIYEIIKNLFKGGTDPTIAHNTLTPGAGFRASASQKLLCDKDFILVNRENIQKNEGVIEFVLTTLKAGFGIFAIFDPIAPTNGTELCTYQGIKTLHLRKNSFVDLIIFLTFSSMLMILFYKNS